MIVQSFDPNCTGFGEFQAFAGALGIRIDAPGTLSKATTCREINLRLGWAVDKPC
jgi:hypothetical protein